MDKGNAIDKRQSLDKNINMSGGTADNTFDVSDRNVRIDRKLTNEHIIEMLKKIVLSDECCYTTFADLLKAISVAEGEESVDTLNKIIDFADSHIAK